MAAPVVHTAFPMPYVNSMKRRTDHPHSSVRNKRCMENRKSTIADDALRAHCDHHDDADGAPGIVAAVIAAGSVIVNRTWSSLGFLISPQASHVNGQEAVPPERPSSINVDTPYLATQTPLPPSPSEASPPFQRIGSANGTRVFTPLARHDSSFNSASMSYSGQTSPTISRSPRRASLGAQTNGVSKHQPRRPHIRHKQTLAQAKEQRRLELIQLRMKNGQSAAEADEYVRYMEMLGRVYARDAFATSRTFLSPSLKTTSSQRSTTTSKKSKEEFEASSRLDPSASTLTPGQVEYGQLMLEGAIKRARDALNSARTPRADFSVFLEDLQSIYKPAKPPLPTSLSPEDKAEVDAVLQKQGVVGKVAREQVAHNDLARLKPAQWLNDEIINFYGALIMARSEEAKKGKCKALDAHYFNSFFFDKLESPGYEKARIGKWTKKIDIFKKDVVILPVNLGNMHWTCAAINFAKKRIEYYDSMGHENGKVYRRLREYLNMEHRDKKKTDFDFTGWEDYFDKSAPQQDNGFDCGVFSCQFMEAISRGADFAFTQANMGYLRQRMILEITRGKLWNQE